ncbi:hypothetical protein KFL_001750285 [Klebsormidium nitens]|uniref:Uncharacterized protein n=1 Tax=Klebsormidium nitens TaxID=105231 RepID=A0A1Y1I4K0_KLENI|nr:hypothetical protein KFL_001750285 [Klebsormidium nitens]|eukprot:GAQ84091.1 hypothetical protein KFL_001750285 [Klebsormidium nitens]
MFLKSSRFGEEEAARKAKGKAKDVHKSVKSPEKEGRPADAGDARGRAVSTRTTPRSGKERVTSPTAVTREAHHQKDVKTKEQASAVFLTRLQP